jgi:glycosyltransferase involved in cell wall biosynthesis
MARVADGLCANSHAAKTYLLDILKAPANKVFNHTYLVPDVKSLLQTNQGFSLIESEQSESGQAQIQDDALTTFLFVGELIPRKGLRQLLQACVLLNQQGIRNYRLLVIGDGEERSALEAFVQQENLGDFVIWLGWLAYGELGAYFKSADALIFPTLEDVWGMVLLEAMAFGQPVLCSRWAGSAELIVPGENGDLFDPTQPEELAALMRPLIQNPVTLKAMGMKAQERIAPYTAEAAVDNFGGIVRQVLALP